MVSHSISEFKEAYASRLRKEGQSVSVDVAIGSSPDEAQTPQSTIDILTDHDIIFCTLALDSQSAIALKSKLAFYGRLSPSWQKVVVAQKIVDAEAANLLAEANIKLVVMSASTTESVRKRSNSTTVKQPVLSQASEKASEKKPANGKQTPAEKFTKQAVYRYPDLNSGTGGDGIYAFVIAFTSVVLIGMIGVYFSWEKMHQDQTPQSSLSINTSNVLL